MIHISGGEDEFNMFICLRGFRVCVFYRGPVNEHKSVCLFKLSIIYSPKVSLLSTNRTHGSQEGVRHFCANNSNLFCHGITGIVYFCRISASRTPGCNWIPEISLPSLTVLSVLEGCTTSGAVSNA